MELKDNKRVLQKMRAFDKYISKNGNVGTAPRGILLNYSNACNFKCQQCFTQSPSRPVCGTLTLDDIRKLADEADELGMYEVLIEGENHWSVKTYMILFEFLAQTGFILR